MRGCVVVAGGLSALMGYASAHCIALSLILVKAKKVSPYLHTHKASVSTWRYIVLVVEIALATPKQKLLTVANPKNNRIRCSLVVCRKLPHPHKEHRTKTIFPQFDACLLVSELQKPNRSANCAANNQGNDDV